MESNHKEHKEHIDGKDQRVCERLRILIFFVISVLFVVTPSLHLASS